MAESNFNSESERHSGDGRKKSRPLRALIVEERVKSFKTRWYRVKETFTPLYVQHTRAFHTEKENGAHIFVE